MIELGVIEQTVTAKIQIKPDNQAKQMLEKSMSVYKDTCNFVADYVFETHQLKQIPLQKAVYDDLRDKFGLKSQMACNVPRTVISKFKSNKSNTGEWIRPDFKKPFLALSFNRDFSILANDTSEHWTGASKFPFREKVWKNTLTTNVPLAVQLSSRKKTSSICASPLHTTFQTYRLNR